MCLLFKGILPIKIVAFDYTGGVNHEIIKNWEESFNGNCCFNFFKKGRNGGGTPTAVSLKIAMEEILARPEKEKLIILLTDENSGYSGSEVGTMIKEIRRAGIKLVGIYFEKSISEDSKAGFNQLFEGRDNICSTPEEIDSQMVALMEKWIRLGH